MHDVGLGTHGHRRRVKAGDRVSGYEIVAPLSAGGMATVYLARRAGAAGFAKDVAIKVVHAHLALDRAFVKMFLDEARLSARIEHPNVVQVYDLGENDGTYFMVMEYVPGCALSQLNRILATKKLRLAPEVAVAIARRVAAGLHAAHELTDDRRTNLGVVHRDVSPQNVLLAFKGHVKLIDFGIAKAAERTQSTQGAVLKGKVRYMAPEQAAGAEIDRRADVFALGVVLWEMLAARRLFDAPTDLLALKMVLDPRPRPPSDLASGIPPALDDAVLAALAKDPSRRPPTAEAFAEMLAQALPAALAIDAPHIADVVGVLVRDALDDDDESVRPDARVSEIAQATPSTRERVQRLTMPLDEARRDGGSTSTLRAIDEEDSRSRSGGSEPIALSRARGPSRAVTLAMIGAFGLVASAAAWYSSRGDHAAAEWTTTSAREPSRPSDGAGRDAPRSATAEAISEATHDANEVDRGLAAEPPPVPSALTERPRAPAIEDHVPTTARRPRRGDRARRGRTEGRSSGRTTIDDVPLDTEFE